MNDFERGFHEELEKIGISMEEIGRAIGQPIRDVAGMPGVAEGAISRTLGRAGEGLSDLGTGLSEQSGLGHALSTMPTPDIQAGHLIGGGLGAAAGGLGGYYAGKKSGKPGGAAAGAALGALGGGALGAGAGHLVGSHMQGQELADQAAQQQEMQRLIGGGRGDLIRQMQERGRDAAGMQAAGAGQRVARIGEQVRGGAEQARMDALMQGQRGMQLQELLRSGQEVPEHVLRQYEGLA